MMCCVNVCPCLCGRYLFPCQQACVLSKTSPLKQRNNFIGENPFPGCVLCYCGSFSVFHSQVVGPGQLNNDRNSSAYRVHAIYVRTYVHYLFHFLLD